MKKSKYRVVIGMEGDDYVWASNLSLEEARVECEKARESLRSGAYARIETDD